MTKHHPGTLYAYGRVLWTDLAAALGGATTGWADYHGFHIGACPVQAPPYTHLWAWTDGWLLRARIDGADAIAGVLVIGDDPIPHGLTPVRSEPVRYSVTHTARTWLADAKRVGPLPPEVTGRTVTLYEVAGENPLTFIQMKNR
jgi:hypothetical protein